MRTALQTTNDVQMIEVLQVGREEMPEAIKTLQRALEREVEKESASLGSAESSKGAAILPGRGVSADNKGMLDGRRASMPVTGTPDVSGLERRTTIASASASAESRDSGATRSLTATGSGGSGSEGRVRDTLDREFIESGIDALRRVSNGPDYSLPSWTITK